MNLFVIHRQHEALPGSACTFVCRVTHNHQKGSQGLARLSQTHKVSSLEPPVMIQGHVGSGRMHVVV